MWQIAIMIAMIGVQLLLKAILPGPKPLETIQITTSAEGQPIPFVLGAMRVAGGLAYGSDVTGVQVKSKAGKLWHYFQTCAYQFTGNPIQNIVRIWADSDVIYDGRPGSIPIYKYPDMGFSWYNGTETQDPDFNLEAIEGVGNVEAFRGTSYMVLVDIPLHQFGYRLPNFTIELASGETIEIASVQRFDHLTNPGKKPIGAGTEYGVLTAYDDARSLFYSVHRNLTDTGWVITKYNTRTGATILEVALPTYFATATAYPTGYFYYSQDGCWQNMMCVSGDGTKLWLMDCKNATPSQAYDLWQLNTSDFSIINTFPLTVTATTRQLADGFLVTNGDGSIVVKGGGLEGAGYGGHTPVAYHVLRSNGQYQRLTFTDHPNTQIVHGMVFDAAGYLHVIGRDVPVATITNYWIRKYQVNTNATTTFQNQRILRAINLALGTNDNGFPVIINIGSVSLSTQVAYNPGTDTINLIVRHDSDGFWGCTALFIIPGTYGDRKASILFHMNVDHLNGDRRYIGGWVTNDYLCAYTTNSVYTDNMLPANAQTNTFVLLNLSTGNINCYDIGTIWGLANYLQDRVFYNPTDRSFLTIATADAGSNPPLRIDQLLILSLPHGVDLQVVCEEACKQVGLIPGDYDFTDFAGVPVTGVICKDRQALREFLSSLQPAYFFDIIESDWMIKGVLRAHGATALTILEGDTVDLGGNTNQQGFQYTDSNPLEVPPWLDVTYMDQGKDYQAGTQSARLPQSSYLSVNSGTTVALPCVMTADEAATAGIRLLDAAWAERDPVEFILSQKYLALEPTDVVDLDRNGEVNTAKLVEGNISPTFSMQVKNQSHNVDVYTQTRKSSSMSWYTPQTVRQYSTPIFVPLDTALLRAADDAPGMYCQVSPLNDTFPINSCEIYVDGVDTGISTSGVPIYGTLDSTPANPLGSYLVWDRDTVITVDQICGAWASQPEADVMANPFLNLILVGDELIQYVSAVQIDDKIWALSTLLRGRFGTESLIGTQFSGDDVVAINQAVMSNIPYDGSTINNGVQYTAHDESHGLVSANRYVTQVCRRLKCFAPFVPGTSSTVRDGGNNITTTFQYRSRVASRFFWPAPIYGTETQLFECDVMNGGTVVRTITATASAGGSVLNPIALTVYYSSADQVTDFGSNQASLTIKLYQMNTILGRGYPGTEIV